MVVFSPYGENEKPALPCPFCFCPLRGQKLHLIYYLLFFIYYLLQLIHRVNQFVHIGKVLQHRAVAPQGGGAAQALHIVHALAAGLRHGGPLALFLTHFVNLGAQGGHTLVQRRLRRAFLAQQRRTHLFKQPRVTQCAAANHNTVTAGSL